MRTLDRIDIAILRELQKEGYIELHSAKLNASKLGQSMSAFIQVTLDRTTGDVFDNFKDQLVDLPGVAQTHTYMVIEEVKADEGLFLG